MFTFNYIYSLPSSLPCLKLFTLFHLVGGVGYISSLPPQIMNGISTPLPLKYLHVSYLTSLNPACRPTVEYTHVQKYYNTVNVMDLENEEKLQLMVQVTLILNISLRDGSLSFALCRTFDGDCS